MYIYFLCTIYGDHGYYTVLDDDYLLDVSDALNISENLTRQIIDYLSSRSLLSVITDSTLGARVKVITAKSIQRRYQEAKKGCKRTLYVKKETWLLKPSETLGFVKVGDFDGFSEKNESFSQKNEDKTLINGININTNAKETKTESKSNRDINRNPPSGGDDEEPDMYELFEMANGDLSEIDKSFLDGLLKNHSPAAITNALKGMVGKRLRGERITSPRAYLQKCLESVSKRGAYSTEYDAEEIAELMDYDWKNE